MAALTKFELTAYAAVALPLAAAALPVHVQMPKFYSALGLDLAVIGAVLLGVRLLDAVSDPLLGALADLLCEEIKEKLKIKRVRGDTYGYLQRSFIGCTSDVDQREAREVGEKAVQFVREGGELYRKK
jgi:hypothetical protein